jgi:hypothetical protein
MNKVSSILETEADKLKEYRSQNQMVFYILARGGKVPLRTLECRSIPDVAAKIISKLLICPVHFSAAFTRARYFQKAAPSLDDRY